MSKAGERQSAPRVADDSEDRCLELVQTVDDLPDRILLGEGFRSGSCAGYAGDQNADDKKCNASHSLSCFPLPSDEDETGE